MSDEPYVIELSFHERKVVARARAQYLLVLTTVAQCHGISTDEVVLQLTDAGDAFIVSRPETKKATGV